MINSKKKGFTIIELVIVIAVIAVLAAVLIPTFSSLVKKAQISADQQAVTQMNKILLVEEKATGVKPQTLGEVTSILEQNGITDYEPYYSGYTVEWIVEFNVVVLVENDKVVFPDEYKDSQAVRKCLSLGKMEASDIFEELGSESDPYLVSSAKELELLASLVNGGNSVSGKYLKLENDIDMSNVETWAPIGTADNPFNGHFDGNDKAIKNWSTDTRQSLFGITSGTKNEKLDGTKESVLDSNNNLIEANISEENYTCVIKNIKFENCNVEIKSYSGLLATEIHNTYVENCSVDVSDLEIINPWQTGILIGKVKTSNIKGLNLTSNNTISCVDNPDYVGNFGLLIGAILAPGNEHLQYNTIINECVNNASVSLTKTHNGGSIGGIVGIILSGTGSRNVVFNNCANNGDITIENKAQSLSVGGILGAHSGGVDVQFINCVNNGDIKVTGNASISGNNEMYDNIGGISAYASGSYIDCKNTGALTGNVLRIGGICARISSNDNIKVAFENCSNTGTLNNTYTEGAEGPLYGTAHDDAEITINGVVQN